MVFINFHTKVNLVTDAMKDNQNFDGLLEQAAEVLNHLYNKGDCLCVCVCVRPE